MDIKVFMGLAGMGQRMTDLGGLLVLSRAGVVP